MISVRSLVIGLIAGALLATAGTSLAAPAISKITAVLRPDYKVKVNGKQIDLQHAPLSYNGTAYVPLREAGQIFGYDVGFDAGTITMDSKEDQPLSDPAAGQEIAAETEWISLKDLSQQVDSLTLGGSEQALTIARGDIVVKVVDFIKPDDSSFKTFPVEGGGQLRVAFSNLGIMLSVSDLQGFGLLDP